jgi:LytS/YehU family sensor histidine kinase
MCVAFVIVAPVSWRVLFPDRFNLRHGGIRLMLYGTIAAGVVWSLGIVVPRILGMGNTLLTAPTSVVVCLALFLVGGWGLGRDMWLENELARAEARATLLAREAESAQLLALRSHLDPHFLFNTLNAIAEWCREDGETAERAVVRLSAMLRTVLAGVRSSTWPLADELALLDTLFELHRLRDPDRVRVTRHLPDPLPDVAVPPMLLLPLAENAVKHGPAAGHAGEIVLTARTTADERLVVSIENPGAFQGRRPGGSGIEIVERRLALAYDDQAVLTIAAVGQTTKAEVTLPMSAHLARSPT